MKFLQLFLHTITFRPYVFIFLLIYLVASAKQLGFLKSLIFLVCGYLIAWASEFSSIHIGFPYGLYEYINSTSEKELWVMGIPFMDSLSYVFLSYSAFSMARLVLGCFCRNHKNRLLFIPFSPSSIIVTTFGAVLFTFLDVIIDPIALRGDKWFLGKIYEYPYGGVYFGVPISNFLGWLFVGFLLVGILVSMDSPNTTEVKGVGNIIGLFLGPLLYVGVLSFNIAVTAVVGEKLLLAVDVMLVVMFGVLIGILTWNKHRIREVFLQCE